MIFFKMLSLIVCFQVCSGCQAGKNEEDTQSKTNSLTMKINGVEWVADSDLSGLFDPSLFNGFILISGVKSATTGLAKTFAINIRNTTGPGEYHLASAKNDLNGVHMLNWTEADNTCGSLEGFDMIVKVSKAIKSPVIVEATFSGKLDCNTNNSLTITDGKFYFHE